MRHRLRGGMMVAVVVMLGAGVLAGWTAQAQESAQEAEPVLALFNYDETRPVLFQPLDWDETPDSATLAPRLTLDDAADLPDSIYLAIENTGWSEGAVGIAGTELDPGATYVLLEVWERMGRRVLRDDGSGMIFPLEYVEDLSAGAADEAVPGFRWDVLIDRHRMFRLYRVVADDGDGRPIWGSHYVREGLRVEPRLASFVIDPDPVWGGLVLDTHIIALPDVTPTPTLIPAATRPPVPVPTDTVRPIPTSTAEVE